MNPDPLAMDPSTAGGGIVYQVALDAEGTVWAAGPRGLICGRAGVWGLVSPGSAYLQSRAVLTAGKLIYTAGLTGGVVLSKDGGHTWLASWIEQTNAPINVLAASPGVLTDGVLLAGTEGAGILRTTDGGRIWQLANFGLRNFSIYALEVIQPWGRREPVYAGSGNGLYYSPNGGRAWKFAGLDGQVVLALAADPGGKQPIVLAGTETGGLYRCSLGTNVFERLGVGETAGQSVNALLSTGPGRFWAAMEDGVWMSIDAGETWEKSANSPEGVLSFASRDRLQPGDRVYAATASAGIWSANADGSGWRSEYMA